jgi:hypothetical protein
LLREAVLGGPELSAEIREVDFAETGNSVSILAKLRLRAFTLGGEVEVVRRRDPSVSSLSVPIYSLTSQLASLA